MFVRRLVSGVRSSCDASATSCALRARRLLEGGEHRVEARGEPAELVVARDLDPLERSLVSVTRSTVRVSRRIGTRAARATTSSPRAAARTTPASATSTRNRPMRCSDWSTSVERTGDLDRRARAVRERSRRGCACRRRRRPPERSAALARHRQDASPTGSAHVLAPAARGAPVGATICDVAAAPPELGRRR